MIVLVLILIARYVLGVSGFKVVVVESHVQVCKCVSQFLHCATRRECFGSPSNCWLARL